MIRTQATGIQYGPPKGFLTFYILIDNRNVGHVFRPVLIRLDSLILCLFKLGNSEHLLWLDQLTIASLFGFLSLSNISFYASTVLVLIDQGFRRCLPMRCGKLHVVSLNVGSKRTVWDQLTKFGSSTAPSLSLSFLVVMQLEGCTHVSYPRWGPHLHCPQ